jgi:threonine dehydrogenase-like Zn-dependent dehydrogenase
MVGPLTGWNTLAMNNTKRNKRKYTYGSRPTPARAYIEALLPDVLESRIEPGRVFDRVVRHDGVPDGYRAMNEREAIKVLIEF